jgi:hypothetical protein
VAVRSAQQDATQPLNAAETNVVLGGDPPEAGSADEQRLPDGPGLGGGNEGATKVFALAANPEELGKNAFADHSALEFRDYAKHLDITVPAGIVVSRPCW